MLDDDTARLALPLLRPAQAQKHVTVNAALERLDLLVQLVLATVAAETPPGDPAEGEAHALGPAPTGAWAGQAPGTVAAFQGGGWVFVAPAPGWRAWDRAGDRLVAWSGTAWTPAGAGGAGTVETLGVNAAADATNRLSVAAPATLFSHEGAGHRLKVNKAAAANTASLLFQSGFSGRAEIGLAGSDALALKVSADGAAWTEALRLDPATGLAAGAAVQAGALDATPGRLMSVGAFGLGGGDNLVADLTQALAPGHYGFLETAPGSPGGPSAFYCTLEVRAYGTTGTTTFRAARITSNQANLKMWHGTRTSATGPIVWTEMPLMATLVGPVGQSGGLPTGAVIERGSAATGQFTRFADGTLECWTSMQATAAAGIVWTYPSAFAAAPVVTGTAISATAAIVVLDAAPGASAATLSVRGGNGSRRGDVMQLRAIGRWV